MYIHACEQFEAFTPYTEQQLSMPQAPQAKKDTLQRIIPSQTSVIDPTVLLFQRRISKFCRTYQLPPINITLCLREALANAIIHGNLEISSTLKESCWDTFETLVRERETTPEFGRRKVIVRCQMSPKQLMFEIEDEGPGFNPTEVQKFLQNYRIDEGALDPIDIASSGRGLLIIAGLMDQVFWNERGNCITMIKNLS